MKKIFKFMDDERQAFLKIKHEEANIYIDPNTGKIHENMAEIVNCPICDKDNATFVFNKAGFDFVKCKICTLLYVRSQLTIATQEKIYKQSKTSDYWIKIQSKNKEQNWNADKKYLPALKQLNEIYPQKGKLLDIGCSTGQFMKLAQEDGWDVEGLELNKNAAKIARDNDLIVHEKKIEQMDYDNESFDLITLWGVFEHLTNPNDMLSNIYKLLKKKGMVLLFVPNGNSLIIRMTREHNSTVSGRAHLWYFTPRTMEKILKKHKLNKVQEFTILPQLHEIQHFLQYNQLYVESETQCPEEFTIDKSIDEILERYIIKNKLGYKLITIGQK